MSYDLNKLTRLKHLQSAMNRVKTITDGHNTRISALENVGAQANVLEGVKVNGALLEIAEKVVDILIATGTTDGTLAVNGIDVAVKGFSALSDKVTALIGSDTSKSARSIAAEEVAKIIADNPDESLDTIAEIAAWIQQHPKDAAEINRRLTALESKVVLGTYDDNGTQKEYATVKAYVEAVIAGLGMANYYTKTEVNAELAKKADKDTDAVEGNFAAFDANGNPVDSGKKAADFVPAEAGKRLMTNEEGTKLAGIDFATDTEVSEMLDEVFGTEESSGE